MNAEAQVEIEHVGAVLDEQIAVAIGAARQPRSAAQNSWLAEIVHRATWEVAGERGDGGIESRLHARGLRE